MVVGMSYDDYDDGDIEDIHILNLNLFTNTPQTVPFRWKSRVQFCMNGVGYQLHTSLKFHVRMC